MEEEKENSTTIAWRKSGLFPLNKFCDNWEHELECVQEYNVMTSEINKGESDEPNNRYRNGSDNGGIGIVSYLPLNKILSRWRKKNDVTAKPEDSADSHGLGLAKCEEIS
eukprot:15348365-Ditylum_brightwellii.AAC.1